MMSCPEVSDEQLVNGCQETVITAAAPPAIQTFNVLKKKMVSPTSVACVTFICITILLIISILRGQTANPSCASSSNSEDDESDSDVDSWLATSPAYQLGPDLSVKIGEQEAVFNLSGQPPLLLNVTELKSFYTVCVWDMEISSYCGYVPLDQGPCSYLATPKSGTISGCYDKNFKLLFAIISGGLRLERKQLETVFRIACSLTGEFYFI